MTTFHCTINGEKKSWKLEKNEITDFYVTDESGVRKDKLNFGDKLNLVVESKGMTLEEVDFKLVNRTVNFTHLSETNPEKETLKKLNNDLILRQRIKKDIENIPLKIISGEIDKYDINGENTFELIHKSKVIKKCSIKVKRPIGPYFVHGTWGGDTSWYHSGEFLVSKIKEIFGHDKNAIEVLFNWSGGNLPKYRINAGKCLKEWIKKDRTANGILPHIPITLVGHSHGGSVSISALNNGLAEYAKDNGIKVNLVTLNTPVIRKDNPILEKEYGSSVNQLNSIALSVTNHYHVYCKDIVQHAGGASYIEDGDGVNPLGLGWQNGGTKSHFDDYKYQKPGAGFRKFYNDKTINIKYKANYRKYFNYTNDGIPDLYSMVNIAGMTGHQGWRKVEVKEWIPLLKEKVVAELKKAWELKYLKENSDTGLNINK